MKLRTQLIGTFIGRPRKRLGSTLIPTAIVLICFALLPTKAGAVSPAPDGWYPGYNTAEGESALFSRTTGAYNTALGGFSLYSDTTGRANTAVGLSALRHNVTGEFNTAVGVNALFANDGDPTLHRGSNNCAFGAYALFANTTGNSNTAIGSQALLANTSGLQNEAFGAYALQRNTIGGGNTAIGSGALNENATGSFNTAVGTGALLVAAGDRNTVVGSGTGDNIVTANNVICIGQGVGGADVSDSCYIGNIWNQPGGSQAVYVNSDGKLGFATSSRRFKDDIKPMAQASEVIYALKPVSFRYKPEIEPLRPRGFGLIAEEVEKLSPDLVTRGADGKVNSVRYDQVNAMLLNEFLKEHRKVEQLEATVAQQRKDFETTITELKKEIKNVVVHSKEQDAKIEKVSARVQMNHSVAQVAVRNP